MTVDQLIRKIKGKFGTISKFARLAGIDRYELQKLFAAAKKNMTPERDERMKEINRKVISISASKSTDREITKQLIKRIEKAVDARGGVQQFCSDNPEINEVNLYHVLQGRRKLITKKVSYILNKLGI